MDIELKQACNLCGNNLVHYFILCSNKKNCFKSICCRCHYEETNCPFCLTTYNKEAVIIKNLPTDPKIDHMCLATTLENPTNENLLGFHNLSYKGKELTAIHNYRNLICRNVTEREALFLLKEFIYCLENDDICKKTINDELTNVNKNVNTQVRVSMILQNLCKCKIDPRLMEKIEDFYDEINWGEIKDFLRQVLHSQDFNPNLTIQSSRNNKQIKGSFKCFNAVTNFCILLTLLVILITGLLIFYQQEKEIIEEDKKNLTLITSLPLIKDFLKIVPPL